MKFVLWDSKNEHCNLQVFARNSSVVNLTEHLSKIVLYTAFEMYKSWKSQKKE